MKPDVAARAEREAAAVVLLREQLAALGQNEPEYLDISIESETGFRELVEELLTQEAEAVALIAANKDRKKDLTVLSERFEKRKETLRILIASALEAAGLPKQVTAVGTASLAKVAPKAVVTDEPSIPTRFWKQADPTLDKAALTEALRARDKAHREAMALTDGEERAAALAKVAANYPEIPGASLSNGGWTLMIKRS
jgi:hypothetical protein